MEPMEKKTRDEVETLKEQWLHDPAWDIEKTEGFEEYHDELLAFRHTREAQAQRELFDEIDTKATDLKCSFEVARYIVNLEDRLDRMTNELNSLRDEK